MGTIGTSSLRDVSIETVTGLAVAIGALPALALVDRHLELTQYTAIVGHWFAAVLVVAIATRLESMSLSEIGFRRPALRDLVYFLGLVVIGASIFIGGGSVVETLGLPTRDGASAIPVDTGIALAMVTALTVGTVEEILYRGYVIERLLAYSPSPLFAGGISWGGFVIAHAVVWPLGNLLLVAGVALVFTLVYLHRRTVFPLMAAHVVIWTLPVLEAVFA